MAHFVELDNDNIVVRGIVVHNNELLDESGNESEAKGIDFCTNLLGGRWIQTSYNGNFRKNYAGNGYVYDEVRDAFIAPKPYPSWILNEDTCKWEPPISYPMEENKAHYWDEDSLSWREIK